jgi:hypothetical protein
MSRRVSPLFATIVILAALVVAGLYFMVRYRAHEAQEAALRDAAQAQMEAMRSSGRHMGRMRGMGDRRGAHAGAPEQPQAEKADAPDAPEEQPSTSAAEGK